MGKIAEFCSAHTSEIAVACGTIAVGTLISLPYLSESGRRWLEQRDQKIKSVSEEVRKAEVPLRNIRSGLENILPSLDNEPGISQKDKAKMAYELGGYNNFDFMKNDIRLVMRPGKISVREDNSISHVTSTSPRLMLEVYSPGVRSSDMMGFDNSTPEIIHYSAEVDGEKAREFLNKYGQAR